MKRRPTPEELSRVTSFTNLLDDLYLAEKLQIPEDVELFRAAARLRYAESRDKLMTDAVEIAEKSGPAYDEYLTRKAELEQAAKSVTSYAFGAKKIEAN